ncbi:MarR family winged helix-turn-helix transcriptional regulator [Clavibacter nebraskensis]|uniref:Transcriptional regulator, MarR family n=3 Tax=Clavibacter nebraskensis TaxID=31963 RepID=A0AAI9EJ59_9MICO|nr:MarR family transcriptional regulator [Clavibacter nebraskensis]KXU21880.1 MarR family transcriptional regulator [Clavibacter nebraskensis]OAH18864.1 MarR family transcriptional regulator [Clavibacter nebraskensis]QGV65558.1 MarR family transcriptional regulator [Clavibacter nebraskensis]QGV68356.1 MarR family transcriptional regulator [Clavibacter nebraskensis]QGV71147.1 MarR family transcriptional regulator [Clavibacter nebraskensis]
MSTSPRSLTPTQLEAYLALTEVASLLRPAVEAQLRDAGDLSYLQFQLLARLGDAADGHLRMTDLADGLVHSRSGLTYQAQLLEQRGLITRSPSPDDERSTVVALTDAGRAALATVFPGHIQTVHGLLFAPLIDADAAHLARILGTVTAHLRAAPPRSASRRRAG